MIGGPVYAACHPGRIDASTRSNGIVKLYQYGIRAWSQRRARKVQRPPASITRLFLRQLLPVYEKLQRVVEGIGKSPCLVRFAAVPYVPGIRYVMVFGKISRTCEVVRNGRFQRHSEIRQRNSCIVFMRGRSRWIYLLAAYETGRSHRQFESSLPDLKGDIS